MLGNDNPRSQDERESDAESQPRDSEKGDRSEASRDVKDTVNLGAEGNGGAKNERDSSGGLAISVKHVKESDDGSSSSSSSSSSSDNESEAVEKQRKQVIKDGEEASSGKVGVESVVEAVRIDNPVVENAPAVGLVEHAVNLVPELVESRLKGKEDLVEPTLNVVPELVESRLKKNEEDEVIPISEDHVEASLNVVEPVKNESEGKDLPLPPAPGSSNGAKTVGDSKITEPSEKQVCCSVMNFLI